MTAVYFFSAALAVLLMVTPSQVTAQQECQAAAQSLLQTCSEGGSIQVPNFLWFVTNGTSQKGQEPADQVAFKTQVCGAETQVGGCIYTQLGVLANTTCQTSPQILVAVEKLLITYNIKCADPCVFSLIDNLRQCYVSNDLSSELFLSNQSAGHIIGSNKQDVSIFCSKKDDLLRCMKPIHNGCPESLRILANQDFHLPSYEKGINILCKHQAVYLTGLECFEEPTAQVEGCVQKSQQAFLQTTVQAQAKNWTQTQFLEATCKLTIDQAECDLTAWGNKNHDACTDVVVGLRREMECNLLPPNCTTLQKQLYDQVCHEKNFVRDKRKNFAAGASGGSSGGSGGSGDASRMLSLPGAVVIALAFLVPFVKNIEV